MNTINNTSKSRWSRPDDALRAGPKKAPTGKAALSGLIDSLMSGDLMGLSKGRPSSAATSRRGLRSQAPKAASNITHRDVKKKFGVRRGYSIRQLISIRNSCKSMPQGCEEIPGAFEEGIGDETALTFSWEEKEKEKEKEKEEKAASSGRRTKFTNSQKGAKSTLSRKTKKSTEAKSSPSERRKPSSTSSKEKKAEPKSFSKSKSKAKINKKDPTASSSSQKQDSSELGDIAPLSRSTTGWKRNRPKTRQEKLRGKITDTLNKITFEKFDTLAHLLIETIEQQIRTRQELEIAISLIFKKTVQESHFGKLYADLCCQIVAKKQEFQDLVNDGTITFKDAIINQCQHQFENAYAPVSLDDITDPFEKEEKEAKARNSALGTVMFIGELYNKSLIPNKICTLCLKELIMGEDPSDLQIESAYKLLLTTGKKLDSEDGRRGESGKKQLDGIFAILKQQTRKNAKRVQILVDILEGVRANNWVPTVAGDEAKTLEQVREEFIKSKGGNKISNSRGQPTIDEWMTEASKKVYKQLKYAVKGGLAIRNRGPETTGAQSSTKSVPDFFDNLVLQSGAVIDDTAMEIMVDDKEEDAEMEDVGVDFFDGEKREEQIGGNMFIKNYLSDALDPEKAPTALAKFIYICKRINYKPRSQLVTCLLNFSYDVKPEEAPAIGKALAEAANQKYIPIDQLEAGFTEFTGFYTSVEMDAPKLNQYFADMTLYLIAKNHLTVEKVMEFMDKDPGIEKRITKKPFGRRAEYLGYLARAAQTGGYEISYDAAAYIVAGKTVDEWKEKYGVK